MVKKIHSQSPDDQKVKGDEELQNWSKLLSTPVDQGGAGINVSKFLNIVFLNKSDNTRSWYLAKT